MRKKVSKKVLVIAIILSLLLLGVSLMIGDSIKDVDKSEIMFQDFDDSQAGVSLIINPPVPSGGSG